MMFYAILFVAMLLTPRRSLILTGALLVAALVSIKLAGSGALGAFLGNPIVFEFLFGLMAYSVYKSGALARVPAPVLALAAVGSLIALVAVDLALSDRNLRWILIGPVATVLVLALVHLESVLRRGGRLAQCAAALGDSSYATYLVHVYVIEFARRLVFPRIGLADHFHTWPSMLFVLGAAMMAGHLLYIALDRPLYSWLKDRFVQRRSAVGQGARPVSKLVVQ
jgi:exopolysaccharide production protein ExoZ